SSWFRRSGNAKLHPMLVRVFGAAVYGIEAVPITIEVNVLAGRDYHIVGLPDSAVRESLQRVESSLKMNDYKMPRTKLLVNLAPAGLPKSGTHFDLPIALGILAATGQLGKDIDLER